MGTKKNSANKSKQSTSELIPQGKEVGGKRLRLNKQTLQDLSPAEFQTDKVRGGKGNMVPDKTYEQECK